MAPSGAERSCRQTPDLTPDRTPDPCVSSDSPGRASLSVRPSSAQVFEYEDLAFSCGDERWSHDWKVMRATNSSSERLRLQACGGGWGLPTAGGCLLHTAKRSDSGTYWCQSPRGQRSNAAHISVHSKAKGRSRTRSLRAPSAL